ncbi:MAG: hypothetical protein HFG89_15285 [Dorea sp.]|jgi:hypothetical protein|nr:hypothetical protein [Dorea sp.]
MTPEEREYFLPNKNLRERAIENYREYEEELKHEQCSSSNQSGKCKDIL